MAKATPVECTPANCGENYADCGKLNTYNYRKCRCVACRSVAAEDHRKRKVAKRELGRQRQGKPCAPETCGSTYRKCGTLSTYSNDCCRCDACSAANSEYMSQLYAENRDERLVRMRQYYEENREAVIDYQRNLYWENREVISERLKQWRRDNPELARKKSREHYQKHRESFRKSQQKRFDADPEAWRAKIRESRQRTGSARRAAHRRRARMINAFIEDVDHRLVFERDDYICQRCGIQCPRDAVWPSKDYPTLDHIVAITNGGLHCYDNVQTMCHSCNAAKGNRE